MGRRTPDDPILAAMNAKMATRDDFGPNISANTRYVDGKPVSYEEWKEHQLAKERERAEAKVEKLFADWEAEMDVRGIMFDGVTPKNRSTPIPLRCTCPRQQKFEANIYQLARTARRMHSCTRCWQTSKPDNLREIVEAKGGKLLTKYTGAHGTVRIECSKGHEFTTTPANLRDRGDKRGSWCPYCYKGSGERKLVEVLAERGCVLTSYGERDSDQVKSYLDPFGQPAQRRHSALVATPPIAGPKRGIRNVTGYRSDGYVFYMVGEVPPRLPNLVAYLVTNGTSFHVGDADTLPKCSKLLKGVINQPSKDHCLNVLFNDQWVTPGVYSWGMVEPFADTLVEVENA